jgi:catalase
MRGPRGDRSRQMVESLDALPRVVPSPGFRPVHAKGVCLEGTFTATAGARELTRAAHMQGKPIRVTVRFSNASAFPRSSDDARTPDGSGEPRGMAVKFHLPGGESTDLIAMSTPFFPVGTVEDFLEIVRVQIPDPTTGKMDPVAVGKFFGAHPESARWGKLLKDTPLPVSFARIAYFPIHAFRFTNTNGKETFARYSWQPQAGVFPLSKAEEKALGPNELFDELRARLDAGPVVFTLHLQLAGAGDDVNNPTKEWPADRPSVMAGTLKITGMIADQGRGCESLSFNPMRLVDGIAPSGDPILAARGGAYGLSAARRVRMARGRPSSSSTSRSGARKPSSRKTPARRSVKKTKRRH